MKDKKYEEVHFRAGIDLKAVVDELLKYREEGKLVCTVFNTHKFYSDTVELESAYKQVTGKTYTEFRKMLEEIIEENKERRRKLEEEMPKLIEHYQKRGKEVLDEKYIEEWNRIVPFRLDDLYEGMELKSSLEIIEMLNSGCTLKEAEDKMYQQGHSGMSYRLTLALIDSFCDRGKDLKEYCCKEENK